MSLRKTIELSDSDADIAVAAELLRAGKLVAFPTETVYGLGADAMNATAVARIYEAKNRPAFNPLIVHLADLDAAASMAEFDASADRLASAFWPGALTLVLPLRADAGLPALVTAGLGSVAIRIPASPVAQSLLGRFGGPIAAPSANLSGRISPTRAEHVRHGLAGRIDAIVDGGACDVGLESTIIGVTGGKPVLLRAGGLPAEAIEDCLGARLADPPATGGAAPSAPGQLASHYAPRARLRLNAGKCEPGEVLLGFGPVDAAFNLSPTGDLVEAAARLFECLHQLDAQDVRNVAVSPVPMTGLGRAINDRLARAAAPRP